MSRLRVYWPDAVLFQPASSGAAQDSAERLHVLHLAEVSEPHILPFRRGPRPTGTEQDIVTRARLIFANRECPHCQRPTVEPVELDDAIYNRNGLPVPGSATLIGFECQSCDHEWGI